MHPFFQVSIGHLVYDTDQKQVGNKQENIKNLLLANRFDAHLSFSITP